MDFTIISFTVGTVLTIIFGYPAFISWIKSKPSKIIFVEDGTINLFNITKKDIEGLEVTFNGNKINKNSYIVRGFFIYQGRDDIDNQRAVKPISLDFSEGIIFHNYKVVKTSNDLEIRIEVKDNRINFYFDLLKDNDFFSFEIFVELKEKSHQKLFNISHRIINLGRIEVMKFGDSIGIPLLFPIVVLLVSLVALSGPLLLFYEVLTSSHKGFDYSSNQINTIYYLDGKGINTDSLNTVFDYRVKLLNKYLNDNDSLFLRRPENQKEYKDLVAFQENYIGIYKKSEQIFYDNVPKSRTMIEFLDKIKTERYKLNDRFSVAFVVDVGSTLRESFFTLMFGLLFLSMGLFLLMFLLKRRNTYRQIDIIRGD